MISEVDTLHLFQEMLPCGPNALMVVIQGNTALASDVGAVEAGNSSDSLTSLVVGVVMCLTGTSSSLCPHCQLCVLSLLDLFSPVVMMSLVMVSAGVLGVWCRRQLFPQWSAPLLSGCDDVTSDAVCWYTGCLVRGGTSHGVEDINGLHGESLFTGLD